MTRSLSGFAACLALGGLLAACAGKAELASPVVVQLDSPVPSLPAECFAGDPDFPKLPEDHDTMDDAAARDRQLIKHRYRDLVKMRRVCRAALTAQFGKTGGKE